jgi:hypothetical protein
MPIILAAQEVKTGRSTIQGQPQQKVSKSPSQPMRSWAWWCTPVILAMWEEYIQRIAGLGGPGTEVRSYLKNKKTNKG